MTKLEKLKEQYDNSLIRPGMSMGVEKEQYFLELKSLYESGKLIEIDKYYGFA